MLNLWGRASLIQILDRLLETELKYSVILGRLITTFERKTIDNLNRPNLEVPGTCKTVCPLC